MSYARRKIMKALADRGIFVLREGAAHTIVVARDGKKAPVPRHAEINRITTRAIAQALGVQWSSFERDIS